MENQSNGMKYYTCNSCGASVASAEAFPRCSKCGASVVQKPTQSVKKKQETLYEAQQLPDMDNNRLYQILRSIEGDLNEIRSWVSFFGVLAILGIIVGIILSIASCSMVSF